jgi:hypothetical protein
MSDDKNKVADKASEIARNIWLAGVGAYGRAVEEAQGRLEKAMEPPKLFRDLVKVGAALEEDARQGTVAARHSVEERINRVRENFHNQRPARIEDLVALHKKIDQLNRKVERLSKALQQVADGAVATAGSPRRAKATRDPMQKTHRADKKTGGAPRKSASKQAVRGKSASSRRKTSARNRKS